MCMHAGLRDDGVVSVFADRSTLAALPRRTLKVPFVIYYRTGVQNCCLLLSPCFRVFACIGKEAGGGGGRLLPYRQNRITGST